MKMTAQMPPIGEEDGQTVMLQIRKGAANWQTIGEADIDAMARTAAFK